MNNENEQLILETLMNIKAQVGALNGLPDRVAKLEATANKQAGAVALLMVIWTGAVAILGALFVKH